MCEFILLLSEKKLSNDFLITAKKEILFDDFSDFLYHV